MYPRPSLPPAYEWLIVTRPPPVQRAMSPLGQERKMIDQLTEKVEPTGIASSKMEPSDSDLTRLNLPPYLATKVEEIASPSPIASGFVVKNGSNMRSRSLAEIPGPESWTEINTVD